jgi:hypothetical protein
MAITATVNPSTNTVVLGFPDDITITGIYRESVDETSGCNIEEIRGEDNAEQASVISGKFVEATVTAIVPSSFTAPAKGTTISIGAVKYMVTDVKEAYTRTIRRLTLTIRKPAVVTYS